VVKEPDGGTVCAGRGGRDGNAGALVVGTLVIWCVAGVESVRRCLMDS